MTGRRLALDLAGLGVQRGVERERAVALVLEAVTFGAAGRQRQHPIAPVQRLNRRLFIDAEDGGVTRRLEVEADDVCGLALEVGVVGGHVALEAMRLDVGLAPNAVHEILADAEMLGEFAAGPMGGTVGGLVTGGAKYPGAQPRRKLRGRLAGAMRFEPVEAALEEALFPARDGRRSRVELFLDGVVGEAVGEQQQDLGAQHEAGGQRLRARNLVELSALLEVQLNGFAFKRHTDDSGLGVGGRRGVGAAVRVGGWRRGRPGRWWRWRGRPGRAGHARRRGRGAPGLVPGTGGRR